MINLPLWERWAGATAILACLVQAVWYVYVGDLWEYLRWTLWLLLGVLFWYLRNRDMEQGGKAKSSAAKWRVATPR